jgi:predicted phage baseplate assembly protein
MVTLPNSGIVTLNDAAGAACLNLETTNPLSWPALFSVMTQVQILTPDVFNLLVLYLPSSGPEGVKLPVIIEQENGISLQNAATQLAAVSNLITVKTFEEGPNPSLSATALMSFDATQAVPEVTLTTPVDGEAQTWLAAQDLLGDEPDDRNFVVEVDTDWSAHLRFGDGTNGKMPPQGTIFTATYRIGNGTAGNVGAGSLTNFSAGVVAGSKITSCTNPLPAGGGIDPETSAQIRRRAPAAFMTQERAVTTMDYVSVTERNPQIEEAAASLRWTGSWYTVFITAEPQNNANLSPVLRGALTQMVNSYRLAGQDILIEPPDYVSLYIVLSVCVQPNYVRLKVEKALMQALGSGTLANGQPAVFAPQNFKLGQTVYLSPIYTAARAVPGVQTVIATAFEPQGESTKVYLRQGFIPMGAFQVARLANDPSLPNHGQLKVTMQGGI